VKLPIAWGCAGSETWNMNYQVVESQPGMAAAADLPDMAAVDNRPGTAVVADLPDMAAVAGSADSAVAVRLRRIHRT